MRRWRVRTRARAYLDDARDAVFGRRPPFTPPRRLHDIGGGDYHGIGREFFGHFLELCDVNPGDGVLDIGCGTGRLAVPFVEYLSTEGSYDGFDLHAGAIRWCHRHIAAGRPNFRFHHVDVRNGLYNPSGRLAPAEVHFPADDQCITFAFAVSVFTHMRPPEVDHYLAEVARVLGPGGRAFTTWFLTEDERGASRLRAESLQQFELAGDGFRGADAAYPERAIGYAASDALRLLARNGLEVVEPIHYGSWALGSWVGGGAARSFQDIVVARPL